MDEQDGEELRFLSIEPDSITVRSEAKREIDVRLVPWDVEVDTMQGLEEFRAGAFDGIRTDDVELMGLEHQVTLGLDQTGKLKPIREEVGYATALENREDGQYATFRIYPTVSGDEVYQRILAGRRRAASLEFAIAPGGSQSTRVRGRNKTVITRLAKANAAIVRRGAYASAEVVAVRTDRDQEVASVAEDQVAAEATNGTEPAPVEMPNLEMQARAYADLTDGFGSRLESALDKFAGRIERIEETQRSQFVVPGVTEPAAPKATLGDWAQYALRALSGDRISHEDMAYRAVADVITSDNLGVVPDAFLQGELIGAISAARPFMSSTRQLPTPRGMTMHVPKIEQRPLVDLQSEEKAELASQAIKVGTADFSAKTKGGVIDISLQLLKQSEPAFLDLATRLMFEAYAQETEKEALEELVGETDFNDGGAIDLDTPAFGDAYLSAFTATGQSPDTIWASPAAVGAMIDTVASGSGLPRYPNVQAGGGASGTISGLRVVTVPQMANVGIDVIIGPSNSFAWAESGAYTLQVDVPSRAGRDVAVVGIVWFAPYEPGAFTGYTLS